MEWLDDPTFITLGMCLAVFRIYLETVSYDFAKLPLTNRMFAGQKEAMRFHRMGFYFSVGYFLTFAPGLLLA